jgi:hypothetical protein
MPITRETICKTLGWLFEKTPEGVPRRFNYEIRGEESTLQFRIPEHQRFPNWKKSNKQKLVDSVFKNYPIHGIVCSKHIDMEYHSLYSDIEDGQTRLSVLQEFYNDGFTYRDNKLFSELPPSEQRAFERYEFTIDQVSLDDDDTEVDHIHEIFDRLQSGQPLRDCDKYWNWSKLPIVKFSINMLANDIWKHEYMGTKSFSSSKRQRLTDVVGLVSSIINWKGDEYEYISNAFKFHWDTLKNPLPTEDIHKVTRFLEYYFGLCDSCYEQLPKMIINDKTEQTKKFWKLGGDLGMILYDWKDPSLIDITDRTNMWIYYINTSRNNPNFSGGKETLWAGLLGKPSWNQPIYVKERVSRVRDLWNAYKLGNVVEYCEALNIEIVEHL